jgi:hypothetical protein
VPRARSSPDERLPGLVLLGHAGLLLDLASFIGSTERTRGITSKLFSGGGDGVSHSSVLAFHGSGPAIVPFLVERTTLMIVSSTPIAIRNAPIVEMKL